MVKKHVKSVEARTAVLDNVATMLSRTPPLRTRPQTAIDMVMTEIAPLLGQEDSFTVQNLMNQHVLETHPVYIHMVSIFFHCLLSLRG